MKFHPRPIWSDQTENCSGRRGHAHQQMLWLLMELPTSRYEPWLIASWWLSGYISLPSLACKTGLLWSGYFQFFRHQLHSLNGISNFFHWCWKKSVFPVLLTCTSIRSTANDHLDYLIMQIIFAITQFILWSIKCQAIVNTSSYLESCFWPPDVQYSLYF